MNSNFACRSSKIVGLLAVMLIAGSSIRLIAQAPPPVEGTVALEGSMKKFYRAANVVVVTTVDGVEHVYHFARDLVVHGGRGPGVDALEGLREGSTVVVHYAPDGTQQTAREIDVIGDQALKVTEGVVTRLDRRRQQITIRYNGGQMETFRLTERAAAEAPKDTDVPPAGKVAIYYSDDRGQKVAHYFKKLP
jgi:hypothetical protein